MVILRLAYKVQLGILGEVGWTATSWRHKFINWLEIAAFCTEWTKFGQTKQAHPGHALFCQRLRHFAFLWNL